MSLLFTPGEKKVNGTGKEKCNYCNNHVIFFVIKNKMGKPYKYVPNLVVILIPGNTSGVFSVENRLACYSFDSRMLTSNDKPHCARLCSSCDAKNVTSFQNFVIPPQEGTSLDMSKRENLNERRYKHHSFSAQYFMQINAFCVLIIIEKCRGKLRNFFIPPWEGE